MAADHAGHAQDLRDAEGARCARTKLAAPPDEAVERKPDDAAAADPGGRVDHDHARTPCESQQVVDVQARDRPDPDVHRQATAESSCDGRPERIVTMVARSAREDLDGDHAATIRGSRLARREDGS
jgi:hypothetical protein